MIERRMNMAVRTTLSMAEQAAFVHLFKVIVTNPNIRNSEVAPREQLRRGFIVVNENLQPVDISMDSFRAIDSEVGIEVRNFNQTLHKSFGTVAYADFGYLLMAQLMNYLSTYGAESMGLKAGNFIPAEKLDLPTEFRNVARITVIRKVSHSDAVALFNDYLTRLKAPNTRIMNSVKTLINYATLPIDDVASFEVQIVYADAKGLYPVNPISGLRYLIYKITGNTLIIKNQRTIRVIKAKAEASCSSYFDSKTANLPAAVLRSNMIGFASIFLRYKDLFLAFKKFPGCAPLVNQLRRMADTYHKPLPEDAVQNYVQMMMKGRYMAATKVLNDADNRSLIKIINFCLSRATDEFMPAVYAVRNGRLFVNEDGIAPLTKDSAAMYSTCIRECMKLLHFRLFAFFRNKIFLMPDEMVYSTPTTEKQMMGTIPMGSFMPLSGNVVVGVHWFNHKSEKGEQRVDIDLHMNSATRHFGWNGGWRDGDETVYSGDMTNAPYPYGAAEAWYNTVGKEDFIYEVNLFSGPENQEFKVFFTKSDRDQLRRNFTFDPNACIAPPVKLNFADGKHMTLGLLTTDGFYFYNGALTSGIVPQANYESAIKGIKHSLRNRFGMTKFLQTVGATVITMEDYVKLDDEAKAQVISLMPEDLTQSTLLDLVDGKVEE